MSLETYVTETTQDQVNTGGVNKVSDIHGSLVINGQTWAQFRGHTVHMRKSGVTFYRSFFE